MLTQLTDFAVRAQVALAMNLPMEPTPDPGSLGLDYTPTAPPNVGTKVTDLLGNLAWIALAVCVALLIFQGVKLARSNNRGGEDGIDVGFGFGKIALAGVIISGGYKIVQWLWL